MGNGEILMSYDDFKSELRDKLLNELEKRVGMPLECRRHDIDKAAEKLSGDFFILPSSLHEVILIPDNGQFEVDTLKAMVKDINESQVAPEDRLTNSVYHYDSKEKIFEMGEKFEARQRKMAHSEKKKSVLAELKAAKEEIASRPKKEVVDKGAKAVEGMAL